jgi:hypothetical protein
VCIKLMEILHSPVPSAIAPRGRGSPMQNTYVAEEASRRGTANNVTVLVLWLSKFSWIKNRYALTVRLSVLLEGR